MQLTEYRAAHGRGALAALAKRAGLAPARLYEIINGHVPTVHTARRIESASAGEVSIRELLGLDTPPVSMAARRVRSARTAVAR